MNIVATEDFFTLDDLDILADARTGLPGVTWEKTTIRNVIDLYFDYNVPGLRQDDFGRRQVYTADTSVTRHGAEAAIRMEARGIRSLLNGQTLMDQLATGFMQRWGFGVWVLTLATTYRRHPFEVLDSIRVTHPMIDNPLTGQRGIFRERFEILDVAPQWLTEGKVVLKLMWTGGIETSAAPTSTGALTLVPGIGSTDETDVEVPLSGSAEVSTEPGTATLIIGLKRNTYRHWRCEFRAFALETAGPPKFEQFCSPTGTPSFADRAYTSAVTYRMEYKTAAAPDSPGTGSDPSTGWVQLKGTTVRGGVALHSEKKCFATPQEPMLPSEDTWTEHFTVLGGAPATYDVKVFFDSLDAQADPCAALGASYCSPSCPGQFIGSQLIAQGQTMSVDYVTSIS